MPAKPRTHVFLRYIMDDDGDGYSNRAELKAETDSDNPASHPRPILVAGQHTVVEGSEATVQLALQNDGGFDASSVEVWAIAPDDTITINDNLVGGGGRAWALSRLVLGARIGNPQLQDWSGSTSKPDMGGHFEAQEVKTYYFRAESTGTVANTPGLTVSWSNDLAAWTALDLGDGYAAGEMLPLADGVQAAFSPGDISAGDIFTVATALPIDTFSYTINDPEYTPPLLVIGYNDPTGNHKFTSGLELDELQTDLTWLQAAMRHGVSLDMVSQAPPTPGQNTMHLVFNNPSDATFHEGKLFVEFLDPEAAVVKESVPSWTRSSYRVLTSCRWTGDTGHFSPTFTSEGDYHIIAFATDRQGTIIDNGAAALDELDRTPWPRRSCRPTTGTLGPCPRAHS